MKLWELRSYDQVIRLEQDRLVYQARLRARYGRNWRRRAPVESLMPLRLARYGVPLAETAPAGLAAAGIDQPADATRSRALSPAPAHPGPEALAAAAGTRPAPAPPRPEPEAQPEQQVEPPRESGQESAAAAEPVAARRPAPQPAAHDAEPAPAHQDVPQPRPEPVAEAPEHAAPPVAPPEPEPEPTAAGHQLTVPVGPGRSRPLGTAGGARPEDAPDDVPVEPAGWEPADDAPRDEKYFAAFRSYVAEKNDFPDSRQFGRYLLEFYGYQGRDGGPLSEGYLRGFIREFRARFRMEMEAEHIP